MDVWVDGWMDGWTDQSKVPLRVSLCVVQLETWHTHIGGLHCRYLYIVVFLPLPFLLLQMAQSLCFLHHDHSSSLSQLGSGAQPDGLQSVVMRDVQLSGKLSPSYSTTISNSCIISSTVYLSFEAIIVQRLFLFAIVA